MDITLQRLAGDYAVFRLDADAEIPPMAWQADFISISGTADELSIVTGMELDIPDSKKVGPWAAYRVAGTLDFALTGILHSITGPLADAKVSVFAISTFDTDYVLVPAEHSSDAERAWRAADMNVEAG